MLYEYASLPYLKKLHQLVTQMIDGLIDPMLALAQAEGRDKAMTTARWGDRDTAENWGNNAWPFLKDLQAKLARDIALRAFDKYSATDVFSSLRGADQSSTLWQTDEEEARYEAAQRLLTRYADVIDSTLDPQAPHWDDYGFAYYFRSFALEHPQIPVFRIRTDLVAETGMFPPRTGVYVSATDPHAALQFAAAGAGGIRLREATTFNERGLDALRIVGRPALWFDAEKMLAYVLQSNAPALRQQVDVFGQNDASLAPSAVARAAFSEHPDTWLFVEQVPDQYQPVDFDWNVAAPLPQAQRLAGGKICNVEGYYFSPARPGSRQFFNAGDTMPVFASVYGQTIWQRDADQNRE